MVISIKMAPSTGSAWSRRTTCVQFTGLGEDQFVIRASGRRVVKEYLFVVVVVVYDDDNVGRRRYRIARFSGSNSRGQWRSWQN